MKNAIKYFYGLNANDIRLFNKNYYFTDNARYVLYEFDRDLSDIDEIYKLSLELLNQNILCHQIIPNKDSKLLTNINNNMYVLLRIFIENRTITFQDILLFNQINIHSDTPKLKRNNWHKLWCNNVDYFEYQISELGQKYKLIHESFNYIIGLTETGISLCHEYSNITLSNRRLGFNNTLFDLYNPINFILDIKGRNICEYFKSCFFNDINIFDDIKKYVLTLNSEEMYMFFTRLFYPSFYFDVFEKIISNEADEKTIIKINNKINDYEDMIVSMYFFLKNYISLPEIEWLQKK